MKSRICLHVKKEAKDWSHFLDITGLGIEVREGGGILHTWPGHRKLTLSVTQPELQEPISTPTPPRARSTNYITPA